MKRILGASVRVVEVEEAATDFHARKSARAKTYQYRICRAGICSPFVARYVWHYPFPLDEKAMAETAGQVEGEHDFTSFAAMDPERGRDGAPASNLRRIFSSSWERQGDEFVYPGMGCVVLYLSVRDRVGVFIVGGIGKVAAAG